MPQTCLPYGILSAIFDVFNKWRKSGGRQDAISANGDEYTDVVVVIPEVVVLIPELLTTLDAKSKINNHRFFKKLVIKIVKVMFVYS